jgi:hypothetical protein
MAPRAIKFKNEKEFKRFMKAVNKVKDNGRKKGQVSKRQVLSLESHNEEESVTVENDV